MRYELILCTGIAAACATQAHAQCANYANPYYGNPCADTLPLTDSSNHLATTQFVSDLVAGSQVVSSGEITAITLTAASVAQTISLAGTAAIGISLQNQATTDTICLSTSNTVSYTSLTSGAQGHCINGFQLAPGQIQGFALSTVNDVYWIGPSAGDVLGISAQ